VSIPQPVLDLIATLAPAPAGRAIEVHDPATTDLLASVTDGDAAAATAAVDAAAAAFPGWAATAPRVRGEALRKAFDLMAARTEVLAGLISAENGKSLADARAEVAYAAEFFRWFSEEAVRPEGHFGEAPAGGVRTIVTEHPVGVAALITPWNFPAAMATRKIGPALAAGCTVVLKPAAETPLTALAVAAILREAGVPEGAVEVVNTTDPQAVVGTWLADPRVRKVSFTGSTGVGKHLLIEAADRVVNSTMELGGNAPFVVAKDADIDKAVAGAMIAKFRNGGQACTAANRFYVHADVVEAFVAAFGAKIEALSVGHAFDDMAIGPMINDKAVAKLRSLVDEAEWRGASATHIAKLPDSPGSFYPPTLLIDVPADAHIVQQEAFGPVAPIVTFSTDEELLALVNGSEFGLAAYVFSEDLAWALKFGEKVESGMVGINRGIVSDPSAPFGGMKQSGIGREGAREGVRAFLETQYLSVDWS
jgi:succinate-semialdehyde dehydrogenase/glutarate-semialdehyde dehydrogenase